MKNLQVAMEIKNLARFAYVKESDIIDGFIEMNSNIFLNSIKQNYGYSNKILEKSFKDFKSLYLSIDESQLDNYKIARYDQAYWNQKWVFECNSFQQYATKSN